MSDIPRINSSSKRKNRKGHEVIQNPEASNFDILETTDNIDDVSGAAKNNGNSIDNDSPPAKKKCTSKNPIPIKEWSTKATSTFVTLNVPATTAPVTTVAAKILWAKLLYLEGGSRTMPASSWSAKEPVTKLRNERGDQNINNPINFSFWNAIVLK
ncbi:uncharacterized protein FTJAE_7659 [Fusarium tjaetaba]|uniref:Uncharacterized protein n=1 Tax=Fusarium tjaetaba TaxID=1567544 RepID=A0A8H5RF49_9HYPO|nr:uncharacterized protein FTJAE_7659 [Fusarium tjaetaba]KAF5632139.1 hypothetical protein FTJAE_7659 [Fusarium tjaetaba]